MFIFYGYNMFYDPTMIFPLIGIALSLLASFLMNSTYSKYEKKRSNSGMTGAMAAERILNSQGIYDVKIERVSGRLTDHYDPSKKVLRLSDATYDNASVAAVGVAAHECGHAIQHAKSYAPLKIRSLLVPMAGIGSNFGYILVILGLIIGGTSSSLIINAGIILFTVAVLFQIVTLPVEFDASKRALVLLSSRGILGDEEIKDTRKVLTAAALTYVAAAAASILQLLRLIIMSGGRNRD